MNELKALCDTSNSMLGNMLAKLGGLTDTTGEGVAEMTSSDSTEVETIRDKGANESQESPRIPKLKMIGDIMLSNDKRVNFVKGSGDS